jgi:hypothetical protein
LERSFSIKKIEPAATLKNKDPRSKQRQQMAGYSAQIHPHLVHINWKAGGSGDRAPFMVHLAELIFPVYLRGYCPCFPQLSIQHLLKLQIIPAP